jgi:hypothetical protein
MSIVRRLETVAVAAALAVALMAPTGAQAWNDRMAEGHHFGTYVVPVGWHVPFAGPGVYGCHRETVWTGRRWRRVRVCD